MPTVRYQIRNEYGLADPELHRAADKDDPEAILEGVAMAGLVGVLRQLGDLAEFAAEIFRDLHEEVMGTAARGHGLMLRVQQLEAEFPSVEKAIFSQSSHSSFAYNDGIDCHSNIQMDQNLITQGDMPRFILDSYEECRGPPRLFTLDKFDTAGAGACLKRYSDPSFFKMELVSSGLMETEIPREKKSRKTRSKAPRWKTGRTLESLLSPHSNSNLQPISDQVSGNSATRLVRLKSRNLNDSNGSKGDNLRKRLLELHSDEQKVVFDNSRSHSNIDVDSIYSSGQTSLMHDTVMDISVNHALVRDASPTMIPSKVATRLTIYEKDHGKIEGKEFSEALNEPFAEVQNPQRNFNPFGSKEKFTDSGNKSEGSAYDYELSDTEKNTSLQVIHHKLVGVELKLEGNTDGYRTEDIGSEQENFMDALNSMESELETDSENKGRPDLGILRREAHEMNSDTSERLEELLQTEISELDFAEVSSVSIGLNNILKSGISSNLSKLVETPSTEEKAVTSNSFANAEFFLGSMHNESCQELLPDEVANSANLISDGASNMKTFYNPSFRSEIREESCNSCVTNLTSNLLNSDPQERFDALKFVTVYQSDTSAGHEAQLGTDEIDNDGLPHFNRSFPEKPPPAEHVEEAILEDMTEMLDMPNHQREHVEEQNQRDMTDNHPADHVEEPMSSSPTGSASMVDPDNKDSLFMIVPTMQEMQDSINKETEAFASKKDTTASSSRRSILTAIPDFVPDTSMDFVQHELAAEVDNVKYPEASTIETSSDYVEGTDDAAQNMNDPSVGSNDNISENPHLACNPVERISEEMAFRPDLSDYLSETEHENGLVKDFAGYIEVPLHPSKVTMGESPQSTNQEAEVNSTETISPPVPVITTSSDKDFTAEMEDIVAVENLEVGFENVDNMAGSNLALPEILQPQLEYFSDTEESQESPRVNSTEEPKDPPKVNSAEQVPLCSESETFSDRVMNSPMLVGANFTLPNEFNQDNPQKNVQGFEQIIDVNNLSAENFASEDTTTRSLLYTQEASGLQLQLLEDSTPDAAVSYLHQLKVHETCSPKTVEASDSQSTLNMALSSVAEQSALDPADICSGLPVKDPSENDARLLGEVCDIMPAGHLQSYLHPCVDETCLECPVQSEQDFGSKCLVQGHHENAKQEMSLSTNLFSDPASLPEEASTLQASDEVKEVDSLYQKGELLELDISTNSIDIDDNTSEGPETNYHDFVGNVEYHELDVPPSNTDETEKLGSDLVSSECSSEISACHMASNVSDMTFSLLSSSDVVVTESSSKLPYEPHSDEPASSIPSQNSEEPPPLPPLPPLEWRSRKLQLHSLLPNENSSQSLAGTNPFMALSANSCMAPSFSSSELLPILVDPSHQYDALSPEGSIVHSSNASSLISSSIEHEKSLYAPDAQKGLKLPLADSLTPCPILESQSSHHFTLQEERIQPLLDERFQTSQLWPSLDLETSHYSEHRHLTLEKEMTQPQNPLLVKSTLEDEIHHHNYGGFRGQNVHVLKSLELSLSSGLEMPQPRYVYSLEGSHSTIFGVVPTIEDEWFSIKHCSIHNRPRNPLIEAVVAHDRSTLRKVPELAKPSNESKADKKDALLESNILQLRKVSELVKPSNKPKTDERDALLEQIRNKSFSLKPAAVSRPNNKGHSTNIKVAAILERANALRQAMAGSDEEDGGDNWSDC